MIVLDNVCVDFPIYAATGRSIKNITFSKITGGVIANDARKILVVRALDGITFSCTEGDRLGLMGPNGSGKSTLLRVIAGVYEPTAGRIEVNGNVMSMISISQGMHPDLTGYENIMLRMALLGQSKRRALDLTEEIIDFSDLGDFIEMPLRTYSSGMAMRLAFSIVTSIDANILIMDEWLSVGDADFSDRAQARLDNVVNKAKILVIASHNPSLIDTLCNKKIELAHGKMVSGSD
jgi:lipopolysaccharide transport system ATP-binding protein